MVHTCTAQTWGATPFRMYLPTILMPKLYDVGCYKLQSFGVCQRNVKQCHVYPKLCSILYAASLAIGGHCAVPAE